jgi:hypothetical protein
MDRPGATHGEQPFFAASQWGCLLFLAALAVVAVATLFRLLQPQPATTYEGTIGPVEVQQPSPWRGSYHLTFEQEGREPLVLRLRNQGPILDYLQTAAQPQRVRITARGAVALSLVDLETGRTVAEPEAPRPLLLAAVVLPVVLLALFAWPWLAGRPGVRSRQDALVVVATEEEE